MTTITDLYPPQYISADDLDGRDHVLTVCAVVWEEIAGKGQGADQKTTKPVMYFAEVPKGVVLNKTNGDTITTLYGPVENWIGQRIVLFPTVEKSFGKQRPVVRVRPKSPAPSTPSSSGLKPRPAPRPGAVIAGNPAERGASPVKPLLSGADIKARWERQNDEAASLGMTDWLIDIPRTDPETGQKLPLRWYGEELARRQDALDEEYARQHGEAGDDAAPPPHDPTTGELESEAA